MDALRTDGTNPALGDRPETGERLEDELGILQVCDVVLGSITVVLSVFATFAALTGSGTAVTAVLMWSIPVFNSGWSAVTKHRNRVTSEAVRSAVSLPIVTLVYVTKAGYFQRFCLPAEVMVIGAGVLWGCLTCRPLAGLIVTLLYTSAIFGGGYFAFDGPLWPTVKHAADVFMTGSIVSLVASALGRSLREARRRRDEAEGHKRHLESALRDLTSAQEQFDAVLECAPASILAVDRSGNIEFANRVGLPAENKKVIGTHVLEHVIPEGRDLFTSRMNAVLATGNPQTLELRGLSATGSEVWYACHLGAMRSGDDVVGVVVISQDVTELKQTQAEFIAAQRMAAVGTLAAGVAHEINTPIQFVSDSTNFLRDSARDVLDVVDKLEAVRIAAEAVPATTELAEALSAAAKAREDADLPYLLENMPIAFDRCIDGLDRVANIVRSMKEFAHPSQRDMATVDLNRAVQSTLTVARSEYKYVANLETAFGELPPVTCYVNDINQVVLNLIVNAAHAVSDAVTATSKLGTIKVETQLDGADVVITVGDTGTGIPEAIRGRIFEPFFTTKEVGKGTGQGLALVWKIVKEKHGGEVTFDTKIGEGTTFRIRLPVSPKRQSATVGSGRLDPRRRSNDLVESLQNRDPSEMPIDWS